MTRVLTSTIFLLLWCVNASAQVSFMGLTPGKSTKADAEGVLGLPVNVVQELLVEYTPPRGWAKLYVQYRDKSAAAVVERIELTCTHEAGDIGSPDSQCGKRHRAIQDEYAVNEYMADAVEKPGGDSAILAARYFGRPRFMVYTSLSRPSGFRWAFYSRELFEDVVPKEGGCAHMLTMLGEWETSRGRMTVEREGAAAGGGSRAGERVRGTYSTDNGTFTGLLTTAGIQGEWKDATGSGTMSLYGPGIRTFSGEWKRTTGSGPPGGPWEGRCVKSKDGGND